MSFTIISCEQIHNSSTYELDTNLFNESIFKMCTKCGVFVHDFSDIFCYCGQKLVYVNVEDGVDGVNKHLSLLNLNKPVEKPVDKVMESCSDHEESESNPVDKPLEPSHICDINEDCSNPDCIDCCEKWGDTPEGSEGSVIDPDYLAVDCGECDNDNEDGFTDVDGYVDGYVDGFTDLDSVS